MADRLTEIREDRDRWAATLDAMDKKLVKVIDDNPWPQKHVSNHLSTWTVTRMLSDFAQAHRIYGAVTNYEWEFQHAEMNVRRPTVAQLWQHWNAVLADRAALDRIGPVPARNDRDWQAIVDLHAKVMERPTRERVEAACAVERAEHLYDRVLRAFEGRAKPTWEQIINPVRVKPPKYQLRKRATPRVRSTYIGA